MMPLSRPPKHRWCSVAASVAAQPDVTLGALHPRHDPAPS